MYSWAMCIHFSPIKRFLKWLSKIWWTQVTLSGWCHYKACFFSYWNRVANFYMQKQKKKESGINRLRRRSRAWVRACDEWLRHHTGVTYVCRWISDTLCHPAGLFNYLLMSPICTLTFMHYTHDKQYVYPFKRKCDIYCTFCLSHFSMAFIGNQYQCIGIACFQWVSDTCQKDKLS